MHAFLNRIIRLQNARQFYVFNCETLFKKCKKSLWISQLILLIEYYNFFIVSLNNEIIDDFYDRDYFMGQLRYVTWANIAKSYQLLIVRIQIVLHAIFYLTLLGYYIYYSAKQSQFMRNPILAMYIQTYSIQIIPGCYFSSNVGGIVGYVNLGVCAITGLIYLLHSHNNYYKIEDYSSRKQDTGEILRVLIIFLMIAILTNMSRKLLYLAPLFISIIGIGQFMIEMPFYNHHMCKLYISLNATLLVFTVFVMTHVINSKQKWLVQALLCAIGPCFVLGKKIHQTRSKSIYLKVLASNAINTLREAGPTVVNRGNYQRRRNGEITNKIAQIEYVARNILQFQKSDGSFRSEKTFFLGQIEMETFQDKLSIELNPQQKATERTEKQFIVDSFLTEKELEQQESLHAYLCALYENYFASQRTVSINDYGYLFYLLEESRNYPKLLVRVAEIKRRKGGNLNLDEEAALNYLMHEQHKRMNDMDIPNVSNSNDSNRATSAKDDSETKIDLNSIFIYEAKLAEITEQIMRCAIAKVEILKCIGQDKIILQKLRNFGLIFSSLRVEIEKGMYFAIKTCGISIELEVIANYFCESLCQDQAGFQERIRSTFRRSVFGQGKLKNYVLAKQSLEQRKLFKREISNLMDELHSRQKGSSDVSCVIQVSLMIETIGRVKFTSNLFREMIGYTREEIVGRNINSLMPLFIGDKHNQMLKAYIERGVLSQRALDFFHTNLFAIRKDGFCFGIEIETQIFIDIKSGEAGILGQIWPSEQQEDAMLIVNLSQQAVGLCQIDCCSEKLNLDIFGKFCDTLHTLKKSSIDEFIPIFSHYLLPKLNPDDAKIRSFDLSTIAFFPKKNVFLTNSTNVRKTQGIPVKESVGNTTTYNSKRRSFNLNQNDVYIVDIEVSVLNDQLNQIRIGTVKFRAYRLIENEDEKKYMLEIKLAPQFEELCGFDREDGPLIQFLDQNHLEKISKNFNTSTTSFAFRTFNIPSKEVDLADYHDAGESEKILEGHLGDGGASVSHNASATGRNSAYQYPNNMLNFNNIEEGTGYDLVERSSPFTTATDPQLDHTLSGIKQNFLGIPKAYVQPSSQSMAQMKKINNQVKQGIQFIKAIQEQQQQQGQYLHPQTETSIGNLPSLQRLATRGNYVKNPTINSQSQLFTRSASQTNDIYSNLIGAYSKRNVEDILTNSQENLFIAQGSLTGRELLPSSELKPQEQYAKMKRRTGDLSEAQVSSGTAQAESGHTKKQRSQGSKKNYNNSNQNNFINHEKQEQTSVTGSKAASSNEYNRNIKKTLILKIKKSQFSPLALKQMQAMVLMFFFVSALFVIVEQIELNILFDKQKRAFSFITWCLNWRNTLNQISKEVVVGWITAYPAIQFISNAQNQQLASDQIVKSNNLLASLISQLSDIGQESDPSDLVVLDQLLLKNATFGAYKDYFTYKNYTKSIFYMMFWVEEIQWQRITFPLGWLPIYDYDQNFPGMTVILTAIQGLQQDQVNSLYSTISTLVEFSLVVISVITAVAFLDVIIVYALLQAQAERVLKLFSTYDPEQIQIITDNTQEQQRVFIRNVASLHLSSTNNSLQSIGGGGGHFKEYAQLQRIVCQKKKKKISQTSSLSKFNIRLLLAAIVAFGILIVQPIANIIFTNQQIDQQKLDSNLLGQIELARATLVTGIVIPYYFVDKLFFFDRNPYTIAYYAKAATRIFPYNSTTFTNLTKAVQQQREQNSNEQSEYESFFFTLMISNGCTPYDNYKEYFTVIKSVQDCSSIQKGIFSNGLLTALQSFVNIVLNLKAALVLSDVTDRYNKMVAHFQTYTVYEEERVFNTIIDLFAASKKFIIEKNGDFFQFTQQIQTFLMCYELIMILLIFTFFLAAFVIQMKEELRQAILVLSVFEIDEIFSNTYILHFLQQI